MNRNATSPKDQRLVEALTLLEDVERVEFKLTVRDSEQKSAVEALDLDLIEAELRQVVFFDTPDLKLNRAGVVVRARRIRKGGDTTVKLRPMIADAIPGKLRHSSDFSAELDVMPRAVVSSGSLTKGVDNDDVTAVVRGERAIKKLFRPKQRAIYEQHAPRGLDLDTLMPFGPINIARLKAPSPTFKGREVAAELWFYPDGSRLLEISTKCPPDEAFEVLAECRALLAHHGISREGHQETKTRKALEYFAKQYAQAS